MRGIYIGPGNWRDFAFSGLQTQPFGRIFRPPKKRGRTGFDC